MICLSGMVAVNAQQDAGDEIINFPAQGINPGPGSGAVTKVFIEINWNEKGDGIYFHIEFNTTVSFVFIVNSTTKFYLDGGGTITQELSVENLVFAEIEILDYQFILPYEDDFYFLILNSKSTAVWMTGWYAKDTSAPIGTVTGIKNGDVFDRGDDVDIYIYYEADRFNITDLHFGRGVFIIRQETLNTDGPVSWTVNLNTGSMTPGEGYINFTVMDGAGNSDSIIINIYINRLPPDPIDPIVVIGIIGGLAGLGAVIGLISYRNTLIKEEDPIEEERPYHKTHRDRRGFKKRKTKFDGFRSRGKKS
jgi:hypothetical protein